MDEKKIATYSPEHTVASTYITYLVLLFYRGPERSSRDGYSAAEKSDSTGKLPEADRAAERPYWGRKPVRTWQGEYTEGKKKGGKKGCKYIEM